MATFFSRPRSCILITVVLAFTASVYLLGNFNGRNKLNPTFVDKEDLQPNNELTSPESFTLEMSKNKEDVIEAPHNKHLQRGSVHFQTTQHRVKGLSNQNSKQHEIHEKRLDINFDPSTDTLIVIHIQKTGGSTFVRHLVTVQKNGNYLCTLSETAKNLIENRNRSRHGLLGIKGLNRRDMTCPHDPLRPELGQWLVSEKNMGWICGAHATLMQFQDCLPHKNINGHLHFMITLRHPVLRYISEYLHFQRNASWASKQYCGGKEVTEDEVPTCFPGFYDKKPWIDINLDKFLSCESNWANNRQTMALADLKEVGCYNKTLYTKKERNRRILENAKDNLQRLAFFGITEFLEETCTLFEKTFDLKFASSIVQRNVSELHSTPILQDLWNNTTLLNRILSVNNLDLELYEFGLELFIERSRRIGMDIDRDRVNKQIASMTPQDINKALKRFKRLNYTLPS